MVSPRRHAKAQIPAFKIQEQDDLLGIFVLEKQRTDQETRALIFQSHSSSSIRLIIFIQQSFSRETWKGIRLCLRNTPTTNT